MRRAVKPTANHNKSSKTNHSNFSLAHSLLGFTKLNSSSCYSFLKHTQTEKTFFSLHQNQWQLVLLLLARLFGAKLKRDCKKHLNLKQQHRTHTHTTLALAPIILRVRTRSYTTSALKRPPVLLLLLLLLCYSGHTHTALNCLRRALCPTLTSILHALRVFFYRLHD